MIDPASAEYEALVLANNDVNGLYDLLLQFDRAFPDDLVEERLRAGKQAVRYLVARDWLRLWYASWTSPDIERAIEPGDAAAVIENPYWWENHIDRMVWFAATAAGREAFTRPEPDLWAALSQPPRDR